MADAVTTQVIHAGPNRRVVKLTNISDGTGESDVVKIDASAITAPDGNAATSFTITELWWNIQGMTSVRLEWDATTDNLIAALSGSGYLDVSSFGGMPDPLSSGTTGDVLLTTAGAVSGGTYTIVIVVKVES